MRRLRRTTVFAIKVATPAATTTATVTPAMATADDAYGDDDDGCDGICITIYATASSIEPDRLITWDRSSHPTPLPTPHSMTGLVAISIGRTMYLRFVAGRNASMKSGQSHPKPVRCVDSYLCGVCAVPTVCLISDHFHAATCTGRTTCAGNTSQAGPRSDLRTCNVRVIRINCETLD